MIRTTILAALLFGIAACAPTAPSRGAWQKPGASEATTATDTAQCRALAQQEAARDYPYGSSNPTLGGAGMVAAQQQANLDRSSAEIARFNDCMEARGYTR
jgi:hypothetical protein